MLLYWKEMVDQMATWRGTLLLLPGRRQQLGLMIAFVLFADLGEIDSYAVRADRSHFRAPKRC
jgi:hypothetical protein